MARYGKCRAINVDGTRCKNDALGNGFCWVTRHKRMYGEGTYTEQLAQIQDFGPLDDPTMPRDNVKLTVAHIKAKLANAKHNITSKEDK